MKLLKSVKGKVMVGTIAVTLFAGAGAAFGASDAGTKLGGWFTGQFNQSKADLSTNVNGYVGTKVAETLPKYNAMKAGTTTTIENERKTSTATANANIDKDLKEHKDALEKKKTELVTYTNTEFNKIFEAEKKKLHDLGVEAARQAQADMDKHTSEKGQVALATLNTELQATTDRAIDDLEAAIEAAKTNLQGNLNRNVEVKTADLKKIVDQEVKDFLLWAQGMANFSAQEQTDLIEAAAKKFEQDAKADMAALVDGI
ncbi:hypothetical protein H9650_14870 [Psychrobacillus sp. Sa2BUA9]|uniref:Uncharacterized protein n=1 Tax=Psychrobacillus faecigallinarum TaxID=2762235 RepID=A0ABR8RC79_9BACI|nr:hypothetical protein [Psychrobacillus faecigallinarum]MBD7945407.1 hypothetical protein [Psychrobacillus faecigallinarum]QGM32188.1 hypothetical protein GI482_18325 [Bacillus sp. N3536]